MIEQQLHSRFDNRAGLTAPRSAKRRARILRDAAGAGGLAAMIAAASAAAEINDAPVGAGFDGIDAAGSLDDILAFAALCAQPAVDVAVHDAHELSGLNAAHAFFEAAFASPFDSRFGGLGAHEDHAAAEAGCDPVVAAHAAHAPDGAAHDAHPEHADAVAGAAHADHADAAGDDAGMHHEFPAAHAHGADLAEAEPTYQRADALTLAAASDDGDLAATLDAYLGRSAVPDAQQAAAPAEASSLAHLDLPPTEPPAVPAEI